MNPKQLFHILLVQGVVSIYTNEGFSEGMNLETQPVLKINGFGEIRGKTETTYLTHRKYFSFTAIPYAKIVKRFLPPEDLTRLTSKSDEIFDGTQLQIPCPQIAPMAIVPLSNVTVEDCLTLNVYTPKKKHFLSRPFPVIFFIHGGSFIRWSGNMWNAGRLLERDLVLVTINYRLGPLGFLCLGIDDAPGNAGMYDMISALRWVNKYIRYFGGDETKVTVVGESAGGASVSWLLDSPLAKGLIHRAVAMSGLDIDGWAIQNKPIENSLSAAKTLNCSFFIEDTTEPDNEKILDCLNKLPASAFSIPLILKTFYTGPSVQSFDLTIPKFAPRHPAISFIAGEQNPIPLIVGTTKNDGSFLVGRLLTGLTANNCTDWSNCSQFLQANLLTLLSSSMGLGGTSTGLFDLLIELYMNNAAQSGNFTEMLPGLIDLYSAFYFKMGALLVASSHSQVNENTYLYSFDYFSSQTYYSYLGGVPQVERGVGHADELFYIFNQEKFTRTTDFLISTFMVNSLANFATTGNPNRVTSDPNVERKFNLDDWPKWTDESHQFININYPISIEDNYTEYWTGTSKGIPTDEEL